MIIRSPNRTPPSAPRAAWRAPVAATMPISAVRGWSSHSGPRSATTCGMNTGAPVRSRRDAAQASSMRLWKDPPEGVLEGPPGSAVTQQLSADRQGVAAVDDPVDEPLARAYVGSLQRLRPHVRGADAVGDDVRGAHDEQGGAAGARPEAVRRGGRVGGAYDDRNSGGEAQRLRHESTQLAEDRERWPDLRQEWDRHAVAFQKIVHPCPRRVSHVEGAGVGGLGRIQARLSGEPLPQPAPDQA